MVRQKPRRLDAVGNLGHSFPAVPSGRRGMVQAFLPRVAMLSSADSKHKPHSLTAPVYKLAGACEEADVMAPHARIIVEPL